MTNLRERNLVLVIILTYITCGIYGIFLYFSLGSEIKNEGIKYGENITGPGVAFLLSLITCGIYGIYYIYKQAYILKKIGNNKNVDILDPILPVLLTIFVGIGFWFNVYSATKLAKVNNVDSNFTTF